MCKIKTAIYLLFHSHFLYDYRYLTAFLLLLSISFSLSVNVNCVISSAYHYQKDIRGLKCVANNLEIPVQNNVLEFNVGNERLEHITALYLRTKFDDPGFRSIPKEVFNIFPQLIELWMRSEIAFLSPKDFEHAGNLNILEIPNNNISNIAVNAFIGLINLSLLSLKNNHITVLRRGAFAGLENLTDLLLDNNEIHTIEDGSLALPKLVNLYLKQNQIRTLSDDVFSELPSIKHISLSKNLLQRIGQAFWKLNNLLITELDDNRIENVTLLDFAQMPKLKLLSLQMSPILQNFNFDDTTETSSVLEELFIGSNHLSSFYDLAKLKIFKNLEALYARGNDYNDTILAEETVREVLPKLRRVYF